MAKANIHTASREELVEAGVRAEVADEIMKLRAKGPISGPEALEELPGVGPATAEQLRKALDLKVPERGERREEATPVERGARVAAEAGTSAARTILRVAHEGATKASEGSLGAAEHSTRSLLELNQAVLDLMRDQMHRSFELWVEMLGTMRWNEGSRGVDWRRVSELQSDYVRQNLDRTAQVTQRCLELGQAMVNGAAASDRAA